MCNYNIATLISKLFRHTSLNVKKHPNANAKQSQGIRLSYRQQSKRQNEQLPLSLFQRDTMQTSQQEEVRGKIVV